MAKPSAADVPPATPPPATPPPAPPAADAPYVKVREPEPPNKGEPSGFFKPAKDDVPDQNGTYLFEHNGKELRVKPKDDLAIKYRQAVKLGL